MIRVFSLGQFSKVPVANEIILLGTVKDSKLIQPAKEYSPIRSIPLGRVVNFRRLQFSNALLLILLTLFPITIEV